MKCALTAFIVLILSFVRAQRHQFNILAGAGPAAVFNDASLKPRLHNTQWLGFNYVYRQKNNAFAFNPGILLRGNDYRASAGNSGKVHMNQNMVSFTLDMLLKISKRNFMRAGLFINDVFSNVLFVTELNVQGRKTTRYIPAVYSDYLPNRLQAGFTLGLCFPFTLFHHEQKFDLLFQQNVTSVVSSDYYLDRSVLGERLKVLTAKAWPTFLSVGFEFSLATTRVRERDERDRENQED